MLSTLRSNEKNHIKQNNKTYYSVWKNDVPFKNIYLKKVHQTNIPQKLSKKPPKLYETQSKTSSNILQKWPQKK